MKYDYEIIGKQLKEKRLSLNKSIEDIVEQIKISEEYLSALEDGRIQDVPSLIYYGLFVRSYANEMGLDPEKMLEDACTDEPFKESKNSTPEKGPKKAEPESSLNNYTSPAKLIGWISAIVIVAFCVVIAISHFSDKSSKPDEPQKSELTETDEVNESEIIDQDSTETAVYEESADQISDDQSSPPSTGPQLPPMTLDIAVSEISWMLVMADSDTVLHRNLEKDAARSLRANESFNISIGNPNGVQMHLNDTLMRPLSRTGRPVTNLLITRENKEEFFLIETVNNPEEDSLAEGN